MFWVWLNTTLRNVSREMSDATIRAAHETAAAERAKWEAIKEWLNNVARSNDWIADSNRNITIPVSEWNEIQDNIKHMKWQLDFISRTIPIVLHNYALLFHMNWYVIDDNDLQWMIDQIVKEDAHAYTFLYKFLSYAPYLSDRKQVEELTDKDLEVCKYIYRYNIDTDIPSLRSSFNLTKLIRCTPKERNEVL